ncbi:unnamed protein product [Protopolystoma xenopodis]|uniref:Uncharacterized protein n=1 Tax=Protopolystoma xenopodis TaxID=117903 RepID=A0A448XJA3_9PLAT|nr:unnamed protein product [Protopolystoma xenopodis]
MGEREIKNSRTVSENEREKNRLKKIPYSCAHRTFAALRCSGVAVLLRFCLPVEFSLSPLPSSVNPANTTSTGRQMSGCQGDHNSASRDTSTIGRPLGAPTPDAGSPSNEAQP